jgi:hypothetical protein
MNLMKNSWLAAVAALTALYPVFTPSLTATPKVEETIVGPASEGGTYMVSRKGARVAFIAPKGSRLAVVVDGVEGPIVDEMLGGGIVQAFGPGRAPTTITANRGGRMAPGGADPGHFQR